MAVRVKNGELFRALRIFREYENKLQAELGLPPDQEMKKYFENLIARYDHT
jgi:hypothetical protein